MLELNTHRNRRSTVWLALMTIVWLTMASPVLAHGENDARPIVRDTQVGPYVASLWQVVGDHGSRLSAHVIVSFSSDVPAASESVFVAIGGSTPAVLDASPSATIEDAWQTTGAVDFGDVVQIGVETSAGEWWSVPVTVPSPPSASLPMGPIISVAVLFSTAVVMWLGRRARRAFSRPQQTQIAHDSQQGES